MAIPTPANFQKHQQSLRILIVDDQPEECARLKAAIENIPDTSYQLSVVDKMDALENMRFYNYDLCIIDNKVSHNTACEVIKRNHLGSKLPTIVYGTSSLTQMANESENEVHDVLSPDTLNPELIDHIIQHAYTQFHFEKKLAALAFTDEMTGLASKRMFEYQLGLSIKRLQRIPKSLFIALFNLDEFQSVSEKFGHVIGDAALRNFANVLTEHISPYDCVARMSGDTFAIVFEEASKSQVYRTVRDIEQVCQAGLFANGLTISLSCSTGIVDHKNQPGQSAPMIMNQAELALMEVKQQKKGEISQKLVNFSRLSLNEITLDEMSCLSKKNLH